MIRKLRRGVGDERGIALVTAMLVTTIVVTLGITAVSLSIHNSNQSANDRRRVQSVGAAEAGLDFYFSHLQSGPAESFECSIGRELTANPQASFEASVTFYDAEGEELPCPPITAMPASALIRSVGTATGGTNPRTMESYLNLVPIRGVPFGDTAVFSNGDPAFNSNAQVFGGESHDGDVYTNGDLLIQSNTVIYGSVFAQGSVTLDSAADIKEDVWARNAISLRSNVVIRRNAISSTSSIDLQTNARVYGDARAGTTITTTGTSKIDGLRTQNSPSEPPPTREFPTYVYDPGEWAGAGYTVTTFSSCTDAKSFINGITGGDHVVRITSACNLTYDSNQSATLRGNLAIVSNGGLVMNSNSEFKTDGNPHTLFLIFGMGGISPCDITFQSNSRIETGIEALLYTPCEINMNSNSLVVWGQVFGGKVNFNSNSNLTYFPIDVPGFGAEGFKEDILYIREVVGD